MKRFSLLLPILLLSSAATAQDQLTVGDLLDLEERIMVKKMTDELTKPNPNAPAAPPVVVAPRAPKIVYPTEALAIYGTSSTYYEGQLSMGGRTYTVRNGTVLPDYIVSAITPQGIELTKLTATPKGKKGRQGDTKKVTLLAPLVNR